MFRISRRRVVPYAVRSLLIICLVSLASFSAAADLTKQQVKDVLVESMTAVLTGQKFSPALQQRQLTLRGMFEKGTVSKDELVAIQSGISLPIMENYRISRYDLKDMPERVEALLAPYMSWDEVKQHVWDASSVLIPEGEQMLITIGTLAPSGTPWIKVPEDTLISEMARLSRNKFAVKIYAGGVMGEDTDVLRKMDIGQLDGCGCTGIGMMEAAPEVTVLLMPGLFWDYGEVDYITAKFRKKIDAAFEKRGYLLSSFADTGYFYLFTKNKVRNLKDLQKQKFCSTFGEVETTLYKELGIDATPIAAPETISVLSTGMANALMAPAAWMLGIQAYQYVGYYIKLPILYSPGGALTSVQTKEKLRRRFGVSELLADNFQELLVNEVGLLEPEWKQITRDFEKRCLEAFETKCGIKAVTLPPPDEKAFQEAFVRVREKMAGKVFPRELMDDILKSLEEYRTGKRKHQRR